MTKRYGYAEFGETILGKSFYPRQREVLDALRPNGSFVVAAFNNGGGKTREVILTAILGHLVLYGGKVISTSGSWRQIKDQLTPALKSYSSRLPDFEFQENRIVTRDPNCFWDGFSTNDAGKFEGHHGDKDNPLLIIFDESKTVKDEIFQPIDRCRIPRQHCRVLVVSSTGFASGEFYRLMTIKSDSLTHPPIRQTSAECPHITASEIEADTNKWGREHPLVKSMHYSEFMPFVEGAIVQLAALDALLADPPPKKHGDTKAFCDFAWSESASGDENVLAIRRGNVIKLHAFRAKGMMAVCGEFIRLFSQENLEPWQIEGDADGEGANIIKQLRAMGWSIGSSHNGGQPRFNEHYANLASEFWCEGAQQIIRREVILPDDPELYGQMLDRKIVPHAKGKLCIESKQAMKDPNREGGAVTRSPDRADAVFGCMSPLSLARSTTVMGNPPEETAPTPKREIFGTRLVPAEEDENVLPGTYFG